MNRFPPNPGARNDMGYNMGPIQGRRLDHRDQRPPVEYYRPPMDNPNRYVEGYHQDPYNGDSGREGWNNRQMPYRQDPGYEGPQDRFPVMQGNFNYHPQQQPTGHYLNNMDRQDMDRQHYGHTDANRHGPDGQNRDNMDRQDYNYGPQDANRHRPDGQHRDNMVRQDNNYGPQDANRQRQGGPYREGDKKQEGPQDANRQRPGGPYREEDKKQEGPPDANRQRSGGQYTQEDEIQEVTPNINRQQKPAGHSQDNKNKKNRNPNIDGGSRLEDFPGMTLTQRAQEMFFEASVKAQSTEARQAINAIATALQDLGQCALDVALGRHNMWAVTAKNQSDTTRRGYETMRLATEVLTSVKEYKDDELVGVLRQITEETQYIHQQFKLEQDGLDEYLKRLHDQRAERDKRKMKIPHYEGWSHKKPKVKDPARSQEQKPTETKTSYAEAAKADTAQAKKETGAISKRGRTPPRNTEKSDDTEKEKKEDADGDDSNDGWQQTREKDKRKRRHVQEEKRKKERDEEEQGRKPRASKDVRKDGTYTKEGQKVEEVTISSTDDQDDRKSENDRRRQKATDSNSDRQDMPDKEDSTTHNMAPPSMSKKK